MRLLEAFRRGEWRTMPNSEAALAIVFGDHSLLVREIQRAATTADVRFVVAGIEELLNRWAEFAEFFLARDAGYPDDRALAVLQGLRSSLVAIENWLESKCTMKPETRAAQQLLCDLASAVTSFDRAWGDGTRQGLKAHNPLDGILNVSPLWQLISQLGYEETSAGFWITWDLVERLVGRLCGGHTISAPCLSATTPVLLTPSWSRNGEVMWLTVELLPGGRSGFDPDPLALGLTAIQNSHSPENAAVAARRDSYDFLDAMRRIWLLSGVADRFRGRWRITNRLPVAEDRFSAQPTAYARRLEGRSAEAAALAAIWAASGTVPYEEPFSLGGQSLPLMLDVAVTADVASTEATPLADIPVGGVGRVGPKIKAFAQIGGDTVLLAANEEASAETMAVKEYDRFGGVRVERLKTIGEALDRMLISNRYLKRWQEHQREVWLARWEHGSAGL